jgi:hypothetical protein
VVGPAPPVAATTAATPAVLTDAGITAPVLATTAAAPRASRVPAVLGILAAALVVGLAAALVLSLRAPGVAVSSSPGPSGPTAAAVQTQAKPPGSAPDVVAPVTPAPDLSATAAPSATTSASATTPAATPLARRPPVRIPKIAPDKIVLRVKVHGFFKRRFRIARRIAVVKRFGFEEFENAKLYFNLHETNPAYLKAASLTFNTLMNTYPDSPFGDEYKLYIIKSDYLYAIQSLEEKKKARLDQVLLDINDFNDRFPDSKLKKQVQEYQELANNSIKEYNKLNS